MLPICYGFVLFSCFLKFYNCFPPLHLTCNQKDDLQGAAFQPVAGKDSKIIPLDITIAVYPPRVWRVYPDPCRRGGVYIATQIQLLNIIAPGWAQHNLVNVYMVSVFTLLAGSGPVTEANSDFLDTAQVYATIGELPKGDIPLAPEL